MFQITPQMVQMGMQMLMSGRLQNDPRMQQFNQLMAGKSYEQQKETLLNYAQSKGFDRGMVEQLLRTSHP
jgi:hypothetical protein